jgi:solute carrier family 25 carnitine/acylcarnitine transporter 20/29
MNLPLCQLKGLYKGVASPMLGVALVNGIIFSSFKSAMNFLSPPELSGNSEEVALSTYFAAGCFSGVVSS